MKIDAYLWLLRLPNLLFLAFVQFMMNRVVFVPILQTFGFDTSSLSPLNITLLIAASVFVAAGGYVINDYFDVKIDAINKPDKQIVGRLLPRQVAMLLHQILTGAGVLLGLLLSYLTRSFTLAFVFVVVPGLLWFYSSNYKRQFLIGNLVIAFSTALSILVVPIMELAVLHKKYGELIFETEIPRTCYIWIGGFALFAFLCTWVRELIKDCEDAPGDREMECRTLPIVWSTQKTKIFISLLIVVNMAALLVVSRLLPFEGSLSLRYIIFGGLMPFMLLIYLVWRAKTPEDYHQASTLSKVIMFIGVLYSFIFYFLTAKESGIKFFDLFIVQ